MTRNRSSELLVLPLARSGTTPWNQDKAQTVKSIRYGGNGPFGRGMILFTPISSASMVIAHLSFSSVDDPDNRQNPSNGSLSTWFRSPSPEIRYFPAGYRQGRGARQRIDRMRIALVAAMNRRGQGQGISRKTALSNNEDRYPKRRILASSVEASRLRHAMRCIFEPLGSRSSLLAKWRSAAKKGDMDIAPVVSVETSNARSRSASSTRTPSRSSRYSARFFGFGSVMDSPRRASALRGGAGSAASRACRLDRSPPSSSAHTLSMPFVYTSLLVNSCA